MNRLISEQAVIESIEFFQMNPQHFDFVSLIDDIKEIPTAEPKTGHWIIVQGMNEQCSNCKKFFPLLDFKCRPFEINYCPNCGAYMVESEDKE